jgi:hypothetical protein
VPSSVLSMVSLTFFIPCSVQFTSTTYVGMIVLLVSLRP